MSSIPFTTPSHPGPLSLAQARVDLPPEEFRRRLRSHLLAHPGLTLAQVAKELKTSRQYVSQSVGKLNRPNVGSPLFLRLSPRAVEAKAKLSELKRLVSQGLSAEGAADQLNISLPAAIKLGFRSKECRPPHGTKARAAYCGCWRCRRASGTVTLRNVTTPAQHAQILDWAAWREPFDGHALNHHEIAHLTGVSPAVVNRIMRLEGK